MYDQLCLDIKGSLDEQAVLMRWAVLKGLYSDLFKPTTGDVKTMLSPAKAATTILCDKTLRQVRKVMDTLKNKPEHAVMIMKTTSEFEINILQFASGKKLEKDFSDPRQLAYDVIELLKAQTGQDNDTVHTWAVMH